MGFNPVIPVGNLVEHSRGGGWGKEAPFEGSSRVAIIRGADFPSVAQGSYGGLPVRYEKDSKVNSVALRAGDIVLENSGGTDSRPTGRTVFVTNELIDAYDCPVIPASFCRLLRFDNRSNSEFVYYWLQEMYSAGRTWGYQNRSTGLSNFQYKVFADSELLPDLPIEVQSKIASVLSAFEKKIRENNRLNDYLLELATALFEHALDKSHTEVSLGDIVDLEDSKRIPLNSRDRAQRKGPYPYYGATAIMDYVDDYLFDGIRILLGEDGTVISDDGKPILQYVWGKYWVNNHAHILKASSIYSLEAIYIALSRTAIKHIVTGAVQMKISQRNLKNLRLTMPSPDEISNLNDLFEMYRQNVEENKALEALRDSILPKLMSGEIDVSQVEVPMQPNNHFVPQSDDLDSHFAAK